MVAGAAMPRPTNAALTTASAEKTEPGEKPRARMSDAERAARGRAQIAAGQYLDDDDMDAFLDGLQIPATQA